MATLSITATNVTAATSGVAKVIAQWGTTITAGMAVYQSTTSSPPGKWLKMSATTGASAEASGVGVSYGIALSGGVDTQWGVVALAGPVTIGAAVVTGQHYYAHATAGLIGLFSDLASTNFITDLGSATTVAIINLSGTGASGLALA